jgi:hypothetical protein
MLNAYTYWFLLNQKEENLEPEESKITKVIRLLIEEPADFVQQLESLL